MKPTWSCAADRYDKALSRANHTHLPPKTPVPQPTAAWPPENVALLEQYQAWLLSSGGSLDVIKVIALPMAGHVLGLNLKPHLQLDLDRDLNLAIAYLEAKQLGPTWTEICRGSLARFRLFLREQRDQPEVSFSTCAFDKSRYCLGLPEWLVEALQQYQRLIQRNWRPQHHQMQLLTFWNSHTHLLRWLFDRYPIGAVADIKRQHILDYIDHCLAKPYAISTINKHLSCCQAVLRYLQQHDHLVPQVLLRLSHLKEPDRLPRFLTDEQVARLRTDLEARVEQADTPVRLRDALLDRAALYLMWQGGLRLGEVHALCLEDVDLAGRRLTIRDGKGRKDRTIYLTDRAVTSVQAYLELRGISTYDHLFLYRHRPLKKDLVPTRLKAAGQRVGVKVSSHRLRHTYATQLLNAGCPVTSIQKLLGHRDLNMTMHYARVHNRTVADDYYAAMQWIEQGLNLAGSVADESQSNQPDRTYLLDLTDQLAEPDLTQETRLALVAHLRGLLLAGTSSETEQPLVMIMPAPVLDTVTTSG